MAKFVQEALIPLQGETITIKSDGREVIIGDHFAEEFARSNDTAHSYAKNKAVKLNSYPNVRDIVEAGVNPQNNPNAKTQHDEKVNPKKKESMITKRIPFTTVLFFIYTSPLFMNGILPLHRIE